MTFWLLDTDHLSLYGRGDPRVVQQILAHLTEPLAVSVVTVEEQFSGWQRQLNQARDDARRAHVYRRMAETVESLAGWRVLPYTLPAMARYAGLLRQRLNVGGNDLRIAATALEAGATVVTRNRRDFGRVPGLVIADWSV